MIYLLGNFGVNVQGANASIVALPDTLSLGDWSRQGLAFYSGSVAYRRTIRRTLRPKERLVVRVPSYRGVAVRVFMNGRSAGVIGWEPNEVDVTEYIQAGRNELAIQVLGHRRNSHGPLHITYRPPWTGPGQFLTTGEQWSDEYQLVPCGLYSPPQLITQLEMHSEQVKLGRYSRK